LFPHSIGAQRQRPGKFAGEADLRAEPAATGAEDYHPGEMHSGGLKRSDINLGRDGGEADLRAEPAATSAEDYQPSAIHLSGLERSDSK